MDKKDLIIINAFPKDQRRIDILEEQINYLKELNLPILLVSGCETPSEIIDKVDYFVLNKDNEILDKDFTLLLKDLNSPDAPFIYFRFYNYEVCIYTSNANCTISKNIKLGFEIAKSLGYETVFYTEDDNIFFDTALSWISTNLSFLKGHLPFKLATVYGPQIHASYNMAFTTFFFADVDFFLEKYTIPTYKKNWYNPENVLNLKLDKNFEGIFYDMLSKNLDEVLNLEKSFKNHLERDHIKWGITNRYQEEEYLINHLFTVIPDLEGKKHLFLYNWTKNLLEGEKSYNIKILYNDEVVNETNLLENGYWYLLNIPQDLKNLKILINDKIAKNLPTSEDEIKKNGLLVIN